MLSVDYKGLFDPEGAGFCPTSGGRIWYRINGEAHFAGGAVPLLCIHGGPGFSHHYLLNLALLAERRPVIFYDQLDCGGSDRPGDPENWRVERFVDEVDALRTHLHLSQLAILGSSWGGTVAAEYAARRPKGLRGLILASPLINTERWIADCTAYRALLPQDVQGVLDSLEADGRLDEPAYEDAVMAFYKRHLCRCDPWPWELERTFELVNEELYRTMWGPTEFSCTGVLMGHDGDTRLHRLAVPTLYSCGEHDEASPAACRDFAGLVPNARVEVFEGCSHLAHLEKPGAYLQVMEGFLSELS